MRKNSLTKAFAAVAVSAIAVSSMATAAFAAEYTGGGDVANAVQNNTITIDTITLTESEAKALVADGTAVEINVNIASSGAGVKFNATGLSYYIDADLTIVQTKAGKNVWTSEGTLAGDYSAFVDSSELSGITDETYGEQIGLFFNSATSADIESAGPLYTFKFTLPESVAAGDFYPVAISYNDGDRFTYGQGTSDAELGDQAYTFTQGITNGGINIVADPIVTTTTAAPTPTVTTTTKAASNNTSAATTTAAATAKTTTTKAADTKKTDSPKTGVAGAGVAVAGLAIAAGTAFVLRKKED